MLRQDQSHAVVHDEEAGLDEPDCEDLHLFYYQDQLGAINTSVDLGLSILRDIVTRWYQVAAGFGDLVHDADEHRIRGHGNKNQIVVEL